MPLRRHKNGCIETGDAIVERLRRACEAAHARYKLPSDWYVVERMPRNAMQKIVKPRIKDMIARGELSPVDTHPATHEKS